MASELVLQVLGDGISLQKALPRAGAVTIGRTPDNDVQVDDSSISRRHAILHVGVGDKVEVEDAGSANGTVVRGVRGNAITTGQMTEIRLAKGERAPVAAGDVISLGSVILLVQPASAVRARGATPAPRKTPAPRPAVRGVVVEDPAMMRVHELVSRVAAGEISVLLLGETGVGKDVVAEAVHRASPRGEKPLLRLNCAALSELLLDSELFGYERGAFTGATQSKPGLLETANGGSVFLDEIGEMPPSTQAKLLRVLEDRQVLPLGAIKARAIDVRFIAATNRDLEAEIERGKFRRDLYFRLNGVSVLIPPLRERKKEVPSLVKLFLDEAASRMGRKAPAIDPAASALMAAHDWPGNVRELKNIVERALLLSGDGPITPEHLPVDKMKAAGPAGERARLKEDMDALERKRILDALEECAGNQTEAAKLLGMPRRTLVKRLAAYGVKRPRKKS